MVSELREDLVTGARVIVAPDRAVRPDTFRTPGPVLPAAVDTCPFCDGHEGDTPPEVARTGPGSPDTPGWRVRVVPNKYPIVSDGANVAEPAGGARKTDATRGRGVAGAHEVVVLSGAHDKSFADLDDDQVTDVFVMVRDRIRHHLDAGFRHAHAFINHGKPAGASIEHPHAQVLALDFVPPFVDDVLERFATMQRDLVDDARDEARDAGSMVDETEVACWCPPASTSAYLVRCAHPDGQPRFDRAGDRETRAMALAVRDQLRNLRDVLGDAPYNVVVNTAPRDDARPYHWWIDITPRLSVTAGFEQATGLSVCTVAPDAAARFLRGEE
jgi:UDPglucose--hexose-1-phosphate uridylyltransferase